VNATIFHSLEELQLQALFLGRSFVCFLYFDVEELPNCAVCTVWEVATVYMSVIYLSVHQLYIYRYIIYPLLYCQVSALEW